MSNVLSFARKKRKRVNRLIKEVASKITCEKTEFDANDFYFDGEPDNCFVSQSTCDYHDIKKGDIVVTNVKLSPLFSDYIVHEYKDTGNILKFSEYEKTDGELLGVVVKVIRTIRF